MKPVKYESRVTYGIEFYETAGQADARGEFVVNAPGALDARTAVEIGRAPLFDRTYGNHPPLYAVVVP